MAEGAGRARRRGAGRLFAFGVFLGLDLGRPSRPRPGSAASTTATHHCTVFAFAFAPVDSVACCMSWPVRTSCGGESSPLPTNTRPFGSRCSCGIRACRSRPAAGPGSGTGPVVVVMVERANRCSTSSSSGVDREGGHPACWRRRCAWASTRCWFAARMDLPRRHRDASMPPRLESSGGAPCATIGLPVSIRIASRCLGLQRDRLDAGHLGAAALENATSLPCRSSVGQVPIPAGPRQTVSGTCGSRSSWRKTGLIAVLLGTWMVLSATSLRPR